jgi:hypothetical protein
MLGLRKKDADRIEDRYSMLRSDFEALQKDFAGLANGVNSIARKRASDLYENGEEWADENLGTLREAIREQPLAAGLVILGAGALLGALMLRR